MDNFGYGEIGVYGGGVPSVSLFSSMNFPISCQTTCYSDFNTVSECIPLIWILKLLVDQCSQLPSITVNMISKLSETRSLFFTPDILRAYFGNFIKKKKF